MVGDASRGNGAKGGRPRGSGRGQLGHAAYEAKKTARKSLQERCRENELELLEILEGIARSASEPANARISAILAVFDRGRGKATRS